MNFRKLAIGLWIFTGLLIVSVASLYTAGYRITLTPSLPRGIYKQSPFDPNQLKRGQIVSFCPPDTEVFRETKRRGYIPPGFCPGSYMPLFKPVAAIPGDTVEVTEAGIKVNGKLIQNSQPLSHDKKGRPMPKVLYSNYTVQPGTVWLISSHHPQSFDSRYVGPISLKILDGTMEVFWVEATI